MVAGWRKHWLCWEHGPDTPVCAACAAGLKPSLARLRFNFLRVCSGLRLLRRTVKANVGQLMVLGRGGVFGAAAFQFRS